MTPEEVALQIIHATGGDPKRASEAAQLVALYGRRVTEGATESQARLFLISQHLGLGRIHDPLACVRVLYDQGREAMEELRGPPRDEVWDWRTQAGEVRMDRDSVAGSTREHAVSRSEMRPDHTSAGPKGESAVAEGEAPK